MATGIISIALDMLDMSPASTALFVVDVIVYATLTVLWSCRAIWFSGRFFCDMLDHRQGHRVPARARSYLYDLHRADGEAQQATTGKFLRLTASIR